MIDPGEAVLNNSARVLDIFVPISSSGFHNLLPSAVEPPRTNTSARNCVAIDSSTKGAANLDAALLAASSKLARTPAPLSLDSSKPFIAARRGNVKISYALV